MLTHYQIFDAVGLQKLQKTVEKSGIILRLKAQVNVYFALVLLSEAVYRFRIVCKLFGAHTVKGVIVAVKSHVWGVIGKTEGRNAGLQRHVNVALIGATCMITSECVSVKISFHFLIWYRRR